MNTAATIPMSKLPPRPIMKYMDDTRQSRGYWPHNKPILLPVRPPPKTTPPPHLPIVLFILSQTTELRHLLMIFHDHNPARGAVMHPNNPRICDCVSTAPGEPPKYPPHSPPPTNHTPACGSQSLVTRGSHHVHPSDPHKRVVVAVRVPFFAHMQNRPSSNTPPNPLNCPLTRLYIWFFS